MSFNGITNLRDAKERVKLKPEHLAEIKKCAADMKSIISMEKPFGKIPELEKLDTTPTTSPLTVQTL